MLELFQEAISPLNLPFTLLLGVVAAYWIIGLLGLIDFDALDGIGGVDADGLDVGDIDGVEGVESIDHDLATDAGGSSIGGTIFNGLLKIVGVSDAPVIFIISVFSTCLWAFNITSNYYLNPSDSVSKATIMLAPIVVVSFILTRLLLIPMRPLMKIVQAEEPPLQIIGSSGRVRSATLDQDFGQVEVQADDAVLILKAKLSQGTPLAKGTEILVVSLEEDSETYIVRPLN